MKFSVGVNQQIESSILKTGKKLWSFCGFDLQGKFYCYQQRV